MGNLHGWISALIQSECAKYKPLAELNYKVEEILKMLE